MEKDMSEFLKQLKEIWVYTLINDGTFEIDEGAISQWIRSKKAEWQREASEKTAEEIGTKLYLATRLIYDDKTRKTVAPFMKDIAELINSQYLSEHIES